jgi:hypothetical protein
MEISELELKKLRRDQDKLQALESGGVDNWDSYDDSLKGWYEENELEESRGNLISELEHVFGECAYEPSEHGAGIAFNDDIAGQVMRVLVRLGVIFKAEVED